MKHKLIETQIDIFNRKLEEIGIEKSMSVDISIKLEDITAYRQFIDLDEFEINLDRCIVYMKSGEVFVIHTPYEIIQKLIIYEG
jgi:hypothetical protein